ncbi:O-antigen ligase family protein [Spongiibacter sp. KMU-158]|uniref:O-antigen ligase family protein n=1 Tax=Spongiibacter pelagi TaxID=2760804 RepID=A0A927C1X1_9GAMM|nr:O-antigen ligase family protein [Spongiibacter pelagi]MBD2857980.1 O-antigen ligase family protein [Spongiibacter pelagi]
MKRYYFLADNLDRLQAIEHDLEHNGLSKPQIHILSRDDCGVMKRALNDVEAVLRKDVVRSMTRGAMAGVAAALVVLATGQLSGAAAVVGWMPFVFLAIVMLGFITWEAGLFGIQEPHRDFRRFDQALNSGRHLLIIDGRGMDENIINRVTTHYPELEFSGTGEGAPDWYISAQNQWRRFIEVMP